MENYEHPSEPIYQAAYAPAAPEHSGPGVKVVTWNIKFGRQVDEAIEVLRETPALADADILLLQEMDEAGADAIARALAYNYVYFPASVHDYHGRNFGNAILSPWPIDHPQKLILPRQNPRTGQHRVATRAIVTIGQAAVLTYSVHTETFWLGPKGRSEQVEAVADTVADTVAQHYDYVIIGGDFNTLTPASIAGIEERLARHNLVRLSAGVGYTAKAGEIRMRLDHIFGSDVPVLDKGVWRETKASDHFPVWVELARPDA